MKVKSLRIESVLAFAFLMMASGTSARADVVGIAGWSTVPLSGAKELSGYLELTNNGDEERSLMVIKSPVSDDVRLRKWIVSEEGVARSWPVGFLKLAPGESVRFDPAGLYVAFADLKSAFKIGDKVPLTLQFDGFEKPFTVMLEVRTRVTEKPAADPGVTAH